MILCFEYLIVVLNDMLVLIQADNILMICV